MSKLQCTDVKQFSNSDKEAQPKIPVSTQTAEYDSVCTSG